MLTADGEVIVLPVKYLDELRNLPPSVVSSLDAQFEVSYITIIAVLLFPGS